MTDGGYVEEYRQMTNHNSSFAVGSTYSWNGPVCSICGQGYLGEHTCSALVLQKKIDELQKMLDQILGKKPMKCCPPQRTWTNDTSACPCRPENGGSGVCNCIFGGTQIIC